MNKCRVCKNWVTTEVVAENNVAGVYLEACSARGQSLSQMISGLDFAVFYYKDEETGHSYPRVTNCSHFKLKT